MVLVEGGVLAVVPKVVDLVEAVAVVVVLAAFLVAAQEVTMKVKAVAALVVAVVSGSGVASVARKVTLQENAQKEGEVVVPVTNVVKRGILQGNVPKLENLTQVRNSVHFSCAFCQFA